MRLLFYMFAIVTTVAVSAQPIDSMKQALQIANHDTSKLKLLVELSEAYTWTAPDSTVYYALQGLPLARSLQREREQLRLYSSLGEAWAGKGNFAVALDLKLKALKLAEKSKDPIMITWSFANLGAVYFYARDYSNALSYFLHTRTYPFVYQKFEKLFSGFIGETYYYLGETDSAFLYLNTSMQLEQQSPGWPVPYYFLGRLKAKKGMYDTALLLFRSGLALSTAPLDKIDGYNCISETFLQKKNFDTATFYAAKAIDLAQRLSFANKVIESSRLLTEAFKSTGKTDSAFKYQEIMISAQDSVYSREKVRQMEALAFSEQLRQQEFAAEQQASKNRTRLYFIIGAALVFLTIALFLWRNNRYKQKAFNLLKLQKAETDIQREKAENALIDLKTTQQQLIQSEKMASLGELTAGIAHEIQNPLNFVNNFSEVSAELVDEMEDALQKNDKEEAIAIATDIKNNLQKIYHHGKRADFIVKGMLQHSRVNTGKKELTDINALADEYLRLSYHGLRAKDKDFNANFKTKFDESIGKIEVAPQDIGRVLLNLYNNAFYSVNEKKKQLNGSFEPIAEVSTKRVGDKLEITVRDNGTGIPQKVLDKIYQPFFTTKPTGKGTGLGLSLSYDIIKAHGGELKVETKEGDGAKFVIFLPLSSTFDKK
jgi:two-component system, NtrC family, sensor kinase